MTTTYDNAELQLERSRLVVQVPGAPVDRQPDEKESFQVTRALMDGLWLDEDAIPGFQANALGFESTCHSVAMKVLACLAWKLGFPQNYFDEQHKREFRVAFGFWHAWLHDAETSATHQEATNRLIDAFIQVISGCLFPHGCSRRPDLHLKNDRPAQRSPASLPSVGG